MKKLIENLICESLNQLKVEQCIPQEINCNFAIEKTRLPEHGDFAANVAMILAKACGKKPRDLAANIVRCLPAHPLVKNVVIAGPGFINFYLEQQAYSAIIPDILEKRLNFGLTKQAHPRKINIEFVSSNPTGPLHVGHGRGAAYGSVLANLLEVSGHLVHREYYVNDAGRQMDILAASVWLRYLELFQYTFDFPRNGYKGEYVKDIASVLKEQLGASLLHPNEEIFKNLPHDETEVGQGDKEAHIDALIQRAKTLLGTENFKVVFDLSLRTILSDIQQDLAEFGVNYQEWFSEASLVTSGVITHTIELIKNKGYTYQKEGALWFRSTEFGDDKDRVLVRENGQTTYFASDIAYLLNKHERGFDELIYVVGADHHGYIARLKAAAQALGIDPQQVNILIVQFAVLYRGEERVPMSTRGGSFITLRALRDEVGMDAARFFYVMRKSDQHMDFDLELAKSNSKHNPVYYLQYAHARICSVFQQLLEKGGTYNPEIGLKQLDLLKIPREKNLMAVLNAYPEMIISAASSYEPHLLVNFLIELSQEFHSYYNDNTILVEDDLSRQSRLCLIDAVGQVIKNGLNILGISAPERL